MDEIVDSSGSEMNETVLPSQLQDFGEFSQEQTETFNRFSLIDPELSQENQDGGQNIATDIDKAPFTEVRHHKKRQRTNTNGEHSWGSQTDILPETLKNMSVDDKLNLVLSKMAANESNISHIKGKIDTVITLNTRVNDLEQFNDQVNDRLTLLELKSIDLEARSRRNNLIFGGFPESYGEECKQTIKSFLRDTLHIQERVVIDRAHRLGRFDRTKQRRIIVRFRDYSDTESILANTSCLRHTSYSINRDYPPEITAARKALWPEYKTMKQQNPLLSVRILYPAKLMVGNKVHRDMFPRWNSVMKATRVQHHNHNINVPSVYTTDSRSDHLTTSEHPVHARETSEYSRTPLRTNHSVQDRNQTDTSNPADAEQPTAQTQQEQQLETTRPISTNGLQQAPQNQAPVAPSYSQVASRTHSSSPARNTRRPRAHVRSGGAEHRSRAPTPAFRSSQTGNNHNQFRPWRPSSQDDQSTM